MPFVEMSSTFAYNARVEKLREFKLEHSIPLRKEQGIKVAQRICNLEHLFKGTTNDVRAKYAKPFCKLEEDDKVYFYKDCGGCDSSSLRTLSTGYVLLREGDPIASVTFNSSETIRIIKDGNKSDFYDRHVPIVEQLH